MNNNDIVDYLKTLGYDIVLDEFNLNPCIKYSTSINGKIIELIHFPKVLYAELPIFFLKDPLSHGQLAHVQISKEYQIGNICVNDRDSVSVNFEQPLIAIGESLRRHIEILQKALTDSDWNKSELLREFHSNWLSICEQNDKNLVCASINGELEKMKILRPESGKNIGLNSFYLGFTESTSDLADYAYINREKKNKKRPVAGQAIILPLNDLSPAPSTREELGDWYLNAINALPDNDKKYFLKNITNIKSREFWIIFNAETPSGQTWFGLHFQNKKSKNLAITKQAIEKCKVTPLKVRIFNKERLMPRSGANISLNDKSVLLIGCGSVGGEIAYKLGSSGIGTLSLSDPETYSLENIYRHVLRENSFGWRKSLAISFELETKYPWIKAIGFDKKLLEVQNKVFLEKFDLIIVAIGSPTHERIFHDFLLENKIMTPVINTWVEGYGIGGHATLDLPSIKGCLRCAYVDQDELTRGLASNMNFFDIDQNLTTNHAGCGEQFLPYSSISATQTALIASDLAIKYLDGRLKESSKVSWKGDDTDAVKNGFILTQRYEMFNESLKTLPLYNSYCDICNG